MASPQQERDREFEFHDKDFQFIRKLVSERTGIVLGEHKRDMIYSRLARRLREVHLNSFSDYCRLLESDAGVDEIGKFVNAVTTNLTSFFREMHHFEHLEGLLKKIASTQKQDRKIRIWSAGCSSGQEPYSISMTLNHAIPELSTWDAKILATDIDTNMLATGTQGEYPEDHLEKIPAAYQKKFTTSADNQKIRMADTIKKCISFKQLNLLERWPFSGPFDIIFCRNVVIYFDKPTQKVLFDRFADMLKPGGFLYIGHSESLFQISTRFELIGRTIYKKLE